MQFINNFRGIAILLVICAHAISSVHIHSGDIAIASFLASFLNNSTVLFVVVAGYLFTFLSIDFNYKAFLKNKFTAVILPYFFMSIPAVIFFMSGIKNYHPWIDMNWFYNINIIDQYILLMTTGAHLGPLWFIPMILIFYLISPLILFIKNHNLLEVGFLVSLVPALFFGRPEHNENLILATLYFLPAYIFGMVLVSRPNIYCCLNSYSRYLMTGYLFFYSVSLYFFDINSSVDLLLKIILSLIVFSYCKEYLSKKNKWLNMFARLSFFLFFIHGYFAGMIRTIYSRFDIPFEGIIPVMFAFSIIVFLSISSYVVLKLILKDKSKIFIGA